MVSSPAFRQDLKRAASARITPKKRTPTNEEMNTQAEDSSLPAGGSSTAAPNGNANETTALLKKSHQHHHPHSRSRERGNNISSDADEAITSQRRRSTLAEFFFNAHHTPGQENGNKFVAWPASIFQVTKATLLSSYVNVLLVFVPLGIAAGYLEWDPVTVFILNFFAIVPLAAVLSFATEEISMKVGETVGGLLNATFGNAVELIVSIVALRNNEIRIVQSSMLGSILSNMLLVLGCCFIAGGIHNTRTGTAAGIEQGFNSTVASTMSSLLTVASASLIIPATLYAVLSTSAESTEDNILILSHGTAIILLMLYVLYLFFQLKTHATLFEAETGVEEEEEEEEEPVITPFAATLVLLLTTILVSVCADYLVGSIDALVEQVHISKTFIGLILLPIVGNAAEHVTAVVVALKDKMDLAMGVAIGSSLQIALLVTPFLVILGWIMDKPMTLHFETFETVVFFLSVLVVTYVIQDGKSNYLEGAMLFGLYIIIALAFLVYPDDATDVGMKLGLAVRGLVMGGN